MRISAIEIKHFKGLAKGVWVELQRAARFRRGRPDPGMQHAGGAVTTIVDLSVTGQPVISLPTVCYFSDLSEFRRQQELYPRQPTQSLNVLHARAASESVVSFRSTRYGHPQSELKGSLS